MIEYIKKHVDGRISELLAKLSNVLDKLESMSNAKPSYSEAAINKIQK